MIVLSLMLLQTSLAPADTDDEHAYVPQGFYASFDLYSIYYHCVGKNEPTVIIEGGIGYSLAEWMPIQEALSTRLRTCVYDRAGYGLSNWGGGERTAGQIAEELLALLKIAKIPGPYILVGHSFGGYVVQYFAKKYPQIVAGAVLVESSHIDQISRLAELDLIKGKGKREIITGQVYISPGIPKDAKSHWYMLNSSRKAIFTQMDELKYFKDSAELVRILGTFPDIPLAVITRDQKLLPDTGAGVSMEQVWLDMQHELASLSKFGWQTIATNSGHSIHIDAPKVIIEEVLKVQKKAGEMSATGVSIND